MPVELATAARTAALGTLSALNFLYGPGWTDAPILPKFFNSLSESQIACLIHIGNAITNFLSVPSPAFDLAQEQKLLLEKRIGYTGDVVFVRRELVACKVIPAWPAIGSAAVCNIADFIDQQLADEIADPRRCLLPESEWPVDTPRSKVHASDPEWYALCKAGAERGIFGECPEDVFLEISMETWSLTGPWG